MLGERRTRSDARRFSVTKLRVATAALLLYATLGLGLPGPVPTALARSGPRGTAAGPTDVASPTPASTVAPLDSGTLPRLLEARAFVPGRCFKALVVPIEGDTPRGVTLCPYDCRGRSQGRSQDWNKWWPASTVKLFAAAAASQETHRPGFTPRARITFFYPEQAAPEAPLGAGKAPERRPETIRLRRLVRRALVRSSDRAFDRLVELVGFDELNRRFFTRRHGLRRTVLPRSDAHRVTDPETGRGVHAHSPPILLREGKHRKRLPERHGLGDYTCPDQEKFTTLGELAESLRRVVMHEELPAAERFELGPEELALLRESLGAQRTRGNGAVDGLRAGLGDLPLQLYDKPGQARPCHALVQRRRLRSADRHRRALVGRDGQPAWSGLSRRGRAARGRAARRRLVVSRWSGKRRG